MREDLNLLLDRYGPTRVARMLRVGRVSVWRWDKGKSEPLPRVRAEIRRAAFLARNGGLEARRDER